LYILRSQLEEIDDLERYVTEFIKKACKLEYSLIRGSELSHLQVS
jgi:hypothetical protein